MEKEQDISFCRRGTLVHLHRLRARAARDCSRSSGVNCCACEALNGLCGGSGGPGAHPPLASLDNLCSELLRDRRRLVGARTDTHDHFQRRWVEAPKIGERRGCLSVWRRGPKRDGFSTAARVKSHAVCLPRRDSAGSHTRRTYAFLLVECRHDHSDSCCRATAA